MAFHGLPLAPDLAHHAPMSVAPILVRDQWLCIDTALGELAEGALLVVEGRAGLHVVTHECVERLPHARVLGRVVGRLGGDGLPEVDDSSSQSAP